MLKTKKEEGNDAFKAGRYQEAHDLYTATLNIDPYNKLTNAKVYFNRAVVLVKVNSIYFPFLLLPSFRNHNFSTSISS